MYEQKSKFKIGVSIIVYQIILLYSQIDKSNKLNSSIQQNYNENLPDVFNITKHKLDNIDLNHEIIKIFVNRIKSTHTFGTNGIPYYMLKVLSN